MWRNQQVVSRGCARADGMGWDGMGRNHNTQARVRVRAQPTEGEINFKGVVWRGLGWGAWRGVEKMKKWENVAFLDLQIYRFFEEVLRSVRTYLRWYCDASIFFGHHTETSGGVVRELRHPHPAGLASIILRVENHGVVERYRHAATLYRS